MDSTTAIIAGSGFRDCFAGAAEGAAETRWGRASARPRRTIVGDAPFWVLRRHGEDHDIPAHAVNYRANVALLKDLGARRVIALNTVGAITDICAPGGIAVPAQLIDYTWGRAQTFFDGGASGLSHLDFTAPFAPGLRGALLDAACRGGVACIDGGVYAVTQGPRLETAAEIDRLERDGADYVGMTAMPEAALAAELGIEYACLALVVNAAAGRGAGSIHAQVEAAADRAEQAALTVLAALGEGVCDGSFAASQ
ncbi:MAG TPA: S-methyl-5'-thioinosine phosphorylase [Woeseiaceae bacterium]|nr:S-methyl-5'-thioinosine phosphorylase [Woeseiaceae bacterium]